MENLSKEKRVKIAIIFSVGIIIVFVFMYLTMLETWVDFWGTGFINLLALFMIIVFILMFLFIFAFTTGRWEQIVIDSSIETVVSTIEAYLISRKIKYNLGEKMKNYYLDPGQFRFKLIEESINMYIAKESPPNPDYTRIWISKRTSENNPELDGIISYLKEKFYVYSLAEYLNSLSTKSSKRISP